MKHKKQYCIYKNSCTYKNKSYLCCNFCDKIDCQARCKDKCSTCRYLTDIDKGEPNVDLFADRIDFENIEIKKRKHRS